MIEQHTERQQYFMREAIREAKEAFDSGEVPIGAVLVYRDEIIARAHNRVESLQDPRAHAEMLCIEQGAEYFKNWRLIGTTLYCTLEPCPMCAGAMIHSRIQKTVWGAPDLRCGANGSWVDLFAFSHPIHRVEVVKGVLAEECSEMMREFFRLRREKKDVGRDV